MWQWLTHVPATCLVAFLLPVRSWGFSEEASKTCSDQTSCSTLVKNVTKRLEAIRAEAKSRHLTLETIEELRTGIMSGKRVDMASAQRQHLEKASPLISEISFDARHRPVSTNLTRHFTHLRTLAPGVEVLHHTFMPLKRSGAAQAKANANSALFVIINGESKISIFNLDGETLLEAGDLGHLEDSKITQMALSPSQENHFVLTADDKGHMRVHNLRVVFKKERIKEDEMEAEREKLKRKSKAKSLDDDDDQVRTHEDREMPEVLFRRKLIVTTNFSCAFELPLGKGGEVRDLSVVLPIDRGTQTYFVTGDSQGGISVFFRNGTMKGRVKVTEDPGGVRGLLRSQGQMILFWSSHSFGYFSVTQIDVQYPPCNGWNAPLFDVALDPSASSSRVVLALEDGDVLVFSTSHGKSKSCDLTMKFPKVSVLPFKLNAFRGHIMALPTPLPDTERKSDYLREIFFFNLAAMDDGYNTYASRTVAFQASFKPRQPDVVALHALPGGGSGGSKSQIAIRYADSRGVEYYDLSMKAPPLPKAATAGGTTVDDEGTPGWLSWLGSSWFSKIGVVGLALIGVVVWNLFKRRDSGGLGEVDEEYLKEIIRRETEKESSKSKGGGGSSAGFAGVDEYDD